MTGFIGSKIDIIVYATGMADLWIKTGGSFCVADQGHRADNILHPHGRRAPTIDPIGNPRTETQDQVDRGPRTPASTPENHRRRLRTRNARDWRVHRLATSPSPAAPRAARRSRTT